MICPTFGVTSLSAYMNHKCRCATCKEVKAISDRIYRESHKDALRTKQKQQRIEHPEMVRRWKRTDYIRHKQAYIDRALARKRTPTGKIEYEGYRLNSRYHLTKEQRELMYARQKGKCAICTSDIVGRNCHTDHDHATGKIRGLLCQRCNMGLGCFKDQIQRLYLAAEYLSKSKQS